MARQAKRLAVHPRYRAQVRACRRGYREFGDRYPQTVLFVAGLPKSGTTWLERMLGSYPGFHDLLIPEVAAHELATGGSHDYELPDDIFDRFENMLVLTKMHVHGSTHNAGLLERAGLPYVVLYRDLRDVAISHYHYVRNTPWHPEHPIYAEKTVEQGLLAFADHLLEPFADWVRCWHANAHPDLALEIRYEQMLEDAEGQFKRVAEHFNLPRDDQTIHEIVEAHSFKRLSSGRDQGQASTSSFFRKGVAGDWANTFTEPVKDAFKDKIGRFLIDHGYETDDSW